MSPPATNGSTGATGTTTVGTWTIAALHERITGLLSQTFGDELWVEGEILEAFTSGAGHTYLTLADPDAPAVYGHQPQLSVTLWKGQRKLVERRLREAGGNVELTEGIRVRIAGSLLTYSPQSRVQLRMTDVDPEFTLGVLGQQRAEVLAGLQRDGLIGRNATVPMPTLPLRIALITSLGSAAHADARHELEHSGVPFTVLEIDARTQGAQAVGSIISALELAAGLAVDAVLLVRGGGSATDLAAFDDDRLARSVALYGLPVVAGIGHEIDRSIVDEVAHLSAKTPTAAAAALVEQAARSMDLFEELAEAVAVTARRRLERAAASVELCAQRIANRSGRALVLAASRIGDCERRTERSARALLDRSDTILTALDARARIHDPALALSRGWSITRTADGAIVTDASSIDEGRTITTTLARGSIDSVVTSTGPMTPTR